MLLHTLSRLGGVAATHELLAAGHGRNEIATELRRGSIWRARQGWYVRSDVDPRALAGLRVGGRTSCITALAMRGVWVPRDIVHVHVAANTSRLRTATDSRRRRTAESDTSVIVHWRDAIVGPRLLAPPLEALRDVLGCQPPRLVFAIASSVMRVCRPSARDWRELIASSPRRLRRLLERVDRVCESGTESIFWLEFMDRGFAIRRQVRIGKARVDFLFGDRLVVEIDGREYHSGEERFESDRRRDAQLSAAGYRVLRFSYAQVMFHWSEVQAAVLAAIVRGDHLG